MTTLQNKFSCNHKLTYVTGGDIRGIAYVSQIGDTDMSAPLYKITKKIHYAISTKKSRAA